MVMATAVVVNAQNPQRWSRELPPTHPHPQPVYERLHKVVIPEVLFKNGGVGDAFNWIVEWPRQDGYRGGGGEHPFEPERKRAAHHPPRHLDAISGRD